ncbi:MAG TPA: hypothetical protein PKA55_01845 [Rhodoblastus sp.]|nr:hypothetical protein [Rhodoblastus sp.]
MNAGSSDLRDLGAALSTSLREHSFGAALLGMGLVWLVASRAGAAPAAGGSTVRQAARRAKETLAESGSAAREALREKADTATQAIHDATDDWTEAARGAATEAAEKAAELADRGMDYAAPAAGQVRAVRERIAAALEKEPLLLAAGGLAIGAAIAATLPVAGAARTAAGEADAATR